MDNQMNSLYKVVLLEPTVVVAYKESFKVPNNSVVMVAQFQANYSGYLSINGICNIDGAECSICPDKSNVCTSGGFVVIESTFRQPMSQTKNMSFPFFGESASYQDIPVLPGNTTVLYQNIGLPTENIVFSIDYVW